MIETSYRGTFTAQESIAFSVGDPEISILAPSWKDKCNLMRFPDLWAYELISHKSSGKSKYLRKYELSKAI